MKLLGITGGIAMGKSTAASLLCARGIPLVDTDSLAHALVAPGKPALEEILKTFGPELIDSKGALRRSALAQMVFSDPDKRRCLENILHPRIQAEWQTLVHEWDSQGAHLGAVVIPLLFETGAERSFHTTVCVACSEGEQRRRLAERDLTEKEMDQRLAAQWPVEQKMAASDVVVWTNGTLETHAAQWDRVLAILQ